MMCPFHLVNFSRICVLSDPLTSFLTDLANTTATLQSMSESKPCDTGFTPLYAPASPTMRIPITSVNVMKALRSVSRPDMYVEPPKQSWEWDSYWDVSGFINPWALEYTTRYIDPTRFDF
jgi:hypothetical protein